MKATSVAWVCAALLIMLNGCSAVPIEEYAENSPALVAGYPEGIIARLPLIALCSVGLENPL